MERRAAFRSVAKVCGVCCCRRLETPSEKKKEKKRKEKASGEKKTGEGEGDRGGQEENRRDGRERLKRLTYSMDTAWIQGRARIKLLTRNKYQVCDLSYGNQAPHRLSTSNYSREAMCVAEAVEKEDSYSDMLTFTGEF
ncbi:hypothetical protein PoB_000132500 [Plakobranchus ocellatus]|uniref:Uncharacterized protein n=1 Tax=Plakobranchus ocellatus TaxID=259542 RepID=A0AAV3XW35_9GAST|nr:hypothetical protein PoB_000132500 [Plakobranchus ocellatus]